jgi:HEAT repeats
MSRPGKPAYLIVMLFGVALVLLPFLFWYDTWFGRPLQDAQIEKYLNETDKPRRAQQALVQIGERISRGDTSVERWYPRVIQLASHSSRELRQTAAWIMGQDPRSEQFHQALPALLKDPEPLVRRNAALALAAFRDPAGHDEIRAMLRPYVVSSDAAGRVQYRLKVGEYVNPGTLIARVGDHEVRSPLPGEVRGLLSKDAADASNGTPLAEISPDDQHAWEALRALFLVGDSSDMEDVQRYMRSGSPKLQQQAALTLREIQSRPR